MTVSTRQRLTTALHACGLGWCPGDDLLAVATYEYDEPTRRGEALLYRMSAAEGLLRLEAASPDLGGVYDVAWISGPSLACATADGRLVILAVDGLRPVATTEAAATIFTSVEWHEPSRTCVVSEQSGHVSIWDTETLRARRWLAHSYACGPPAEVWCATRRRDLLLTGADDALVVGWDLRTSIRAFSSPMGTHGAGVTAVSFLPEDDRAFLTGSYDQSARLWDSRRPRSPLADLDLGGGVWRFRWRGMADLVAPCATGGAVLLHVGRPKGLLQVTARYGGHDPEAITYGADVYRGANTILESCYASCSFYDNQLHLWNHP